MAFVPRAGGNAVPRPARRKSPVAKVPLTSAEVAWAVPLGRKWGILWSGTCVFSLYRSLPTFCNREIGNCLCSHLGGSCSLFS